MRASRPDQTARRREGLWDLRPTAFWEFVKTQPASFWLVCGYLMWEYVRPQSIYRSIDVLPWALMTIIACLVAALMEGRNLFGIRNPIDSLIWAYTAIVLASIVGAYEPDASFEDLDLYLSWVLIYFLISRVNDAHEKLFVFFVSFLLYNLKMSLFATRGWAADGFVFRSWGAVGGPGWFHNSGEFGIEMTIFVPTVAAFYWALAPRLSKWKRLALLGMPATAVIGAVASSSRGALLGIGGVLAWFLAKSKHKVRALAIAAFTVGIAMVALPEEQKTRLDTMGTDTTSVTRITMWKDGIRIATEYPVLGIGYANWLPYYRDNYNPRGQVSHNIFIQAVSELGFVGLTGFLALIGATLVVNARTRRLAKKLTGYEGRLAYAMAHGFDGALIGFLVSGFFVTVLYYPFFWINLAFTAALYNNTRKATWPQRMGGGRARPGARQSIHHARGVSRAMRRTNLESS